MADMADRAYQEAQSLLDEQIRQARLGRADNLVSHCMDCGNPIGEARKKALPWAVRCVGCQWQFERTHERRVR